MSMVQTPVMPTESQVNRGPKDKATLEKLAYSYREAGWIGGFCERTAAELVKTGKLKAFRVGRSVRIPRWAIEEFIKSRMEAGLDSQN